MKKKIKRLATLLLTCLLFAGILSACSTDKGEKEDTGQNTNTETNTDTETNKDTTDTNEEESELSGTITMSGSTSMEKLANVVAEAFMLEHPGVTVSPEFIGSSAGVEAVIAGTVNIGNASRNLKDTEKEAGAVENIVAIDGIAIIIDKANTVTNLTKDQLTKIYTGEITNWSEVGGAEQPIVVVGRESGSGTRGAFEEILEIEDMAKYSNEINSTGGVMAKVASTPGSIGYVSLDVINNSVITINLEGVEATADNIKAGNYFLSRPFVMATKGEITEQSELVQAFFEYLNSDDGKSLIESVGLITAE
ncbi:MAG: phosphate ABC transporter substrate-binding protein [Clostridiales bacterium]|nr:phosphate ABC transporter substrate-binding protein [Clostridiales bacterium]